MATFNQKLLSWYGVSKRPLPWRSTRDPYKIWLSEIILQQTRVDQGMSYYLKFVSRYPKVDDLANAGEQAVLKLWEGLGYYSRARNLYQTACHIVANHQSVFPGRYADLLKLRGVGPYTAAAIASIAFGEKVASIDGNVLRVCARLFLIEDPIDQSKTQKKIQSLVQEMMMDEVENPADFNQAMMELGATICTPKNPACKRCPVHMHCLAFAAQKQAGLPVKAGKVKKGKLFFNYLVPDNDGHTLISKREKGIWIGLFQFPLIVSDKKLLGRKQIIAETGKAGFTGVGQLSASPVVKHILTHRSISARFWYFEAGFPGDIASGKSVSFEALKQYPMPQLLVNFINSDFFVRGLNH